MVKLLKTGRHVCAKRNYSRAIYLYGWISHTIDIQKLKPYDWQSTKPRFFA